jgi:hypothetical protein
MLCCVVVRYRVPRDSTLTALGHYVSLRGLLPLLCSLLCLVSVYAFRLCLRSLYRLPVRLDGSPGTDTNGRVQSTTTGPGSKGDSDLTVVYSLALSLWVTRLLLTCLDTSCQWCVSVLACWYSSTVSVRSAGPIPD